MNAWIGFLFTFIWASGAVATKVGLFSSSPLLFATIRLLLAGGLLFVFAYVFRTYPWPKHSEWKSLIVLGMLNTTLYVGCVFLSLQYVSASLFNLFLTVNPFVVAGFSAVFLRRRLAGREWAGMAVAASGLFVAIAPYFHTMDGTLFGVVVLGIGMLSMAIGSVYFHYKKPALPHIVVNTWQLIIGGVLSLPLMLIFERKYTLIFDGYFFIGLFWQVVVVSIIGMVLWFHLLQQDAVRANNFLFFTPVLGYFLAAVFLDEQITIYHMLSAFLVMGGLMISKTVDTTRVVLFVKRTFL